MNTLINSFDYRKSKNTIPFTGVYEIVSQYSNIFIFVDTSGNDTLFIEFDNVNTFDDVADTKYAYTESFNINNGTRSINISPKMKYFRIRIESSTVGSNIKRIYNTYYFHTSALTGTDENGNLYTHPKISNTDSDILIYGNDGTNNQKLFNLNTSVKIDYDVISVWHFTCRDY